ncbi:hypothetical protein [Candidatus Poriferisodalis sp.]|uniref:hypothetical protein n=1 Tax=Candidatus Poriferisodalis sp. TaxID=3101277 RepID=UPI003B5C9551
MPVLILDSGAVTHLAQQREQSLADIEELKRQRLWPPIVPTIVLAECISGRQDTDALVYKFLKMCETQDALPRKIAQRAGDLRTRAKAGSVVDAVLVAMAEPGTTILTADLKDLDRLAIHAQQVTIRSLHPRRRRNP